MFVMLGTIQQKRIDNGEIAVAIEFHIDEVHTLLNSPFSAKYLC